MSISNEMARYWADEGAEANDRPPQRIEENVFTGTAAIELGAGFKAGMLRLPEGADTPWEAATPLLDAHLAEEDAEEKTLFDKIEALETAWADLGPKVHLTPDVAGVHLLLGGVIEALKELAYATKGALKELVYASKPSG